MIRTEELHIPDHLRDDVSSNIDPACAMITDCDAELFEEMPDDMRRMYDELNSKLRSKRNACMLDESLNVMSSNLPLYDISYDISW